MESRWAKVVVFAVGLSLAGAACSSKKTESSSGGGESGGKITIGSEQANNHGTKNLTGKTETEVKVDSFYFNPTVIEGTAGQQIKLDLSNESNTLHNFSLDGASTSQDLQPGGNEVVTVTLPQSGTMVFFCKYHRASGMLGELEVAT